MLLLLQLQNGKVLTIFAPFGGKYELTVLQNHNILLFPVLCNG